MQCSIRSDLYTFVIAKEHEVPFYVAAPVSTFDFERLEDDIEIELRKPKTEVFWEVPDSPSE